LNFLFSQYKTRTDIAKKIIIATTKRTMRVKEEIREKKEEIGGGEYILSSAF
jgi:hypothetical protein